MKNYNDKIEREGIVIMLYGKAGLGKTYLASTAENSVLFDFDNGLYRSEFKPNNYVIVENYKQFLNDFDKVTKTADTIIIDTIDMQIQTYDIHLCQTNAKYTRNVLQKYGQIKKEMQEKTRILKKSGKNVIFLAHSKKTKIDDYIYNEPKITGSSSEDIPTLCDAIGFMDSKNKDVFVTFNSSQFNEGKNSANIADFTIPRFENAILAVGYIDNLLNTMKNTLNNRQDEVSKLRNLLYEYRTKINNCKDKSALEIIGKELKDGDLHKDLKTALKGYYSNKLRSFENEKTTS